MFMQEHTAGRAKRRKKELPQMDERSSMSHAFAKAFEVWEADFRKDPTAFLDAEAIAALDIATLGESRAVCFESILNKLAAGRPWETIE